MDSLVSIVPSEEGLMSAVSTMRFAPRQAKVKRGVTMRARERATRNEGGDEILGGKGGAVHIATNMNKTCERQCSIKIWLHLFAIFCLVFRRISDRLLMR